MGLPVSGPPSICVPGCVKGKSGPNPCHSALGSASQSRGGNSALEDDRNGAEQGGGHGGRCQLGTGLQGDRKRGPSSGVLRPLGERLALPQGWMLKPFYFYIVERGSAKGCGHPRGSRGILGFPASSSEAAHLQLAGCKSSEMQSEASLPTRSTTMELSLGPFHPFLPSSSFNSLSAIKASVQGPAFAQTEAGNEEGRRICKTAPEADPCCTE